MKKAFLLVVILFVATISTGCVNNMAVQQLNNKAKTYLDQGDFENAISRLKASIDLDNTIFETHYNLGIAYTQAENYPQAIEAFDKAAKLNPTFADTYYSIAVAQEDYANAIINDTLKKDKIDGENSDEETLSENMTSEMSTKKKVLNTQEKMQVADLLENAIKSYSSYLRMASKINDREEIEQKITDLNNQLLNYKTAQ